jgi:hypothetical protein
MCGDWEAAQDILGEAVCASQVRGELQVRRWACRALAELDILQGQPGVARGRLASVPDRDGLKEFDVTALLPTLAWAQREEGDAAQAAQTVEQALVRMRAEDLQLMLVDDLRVQALILSRQGQLADAERAVQEGLRLACAMPSPYMEARLLHEDGVLQVQAGPACAGAGAAGHGAADLETAGRTEGHRAHGATTGDAWLTRADPAVPDSPCGVACVAIVRSSRVRL